MDEEKKESDFDFMHPAITYSPTPVCEEELKRSDKEKIQKIEGHFREIMETLGLDLSDPSLEKTPHRVARMYVEEIFSGLKKENFPSMTFIPDTIHQERRANIVMVKSSFVSFCEHHFLPFRGEAHLAYLPQEKLIGLSKIPRLVRYFAKRPQVQERLTAQIADAFSSLLNHENIAVSLKADHFCVIARGVEDEESYTVTNELRGAFHSNDLLRREFFEAISRSPR